jgi:hypothetical protein
MLNFNTSARAQFAEDNKLFGGVLLERILCALPRSLCKCFMLLNKHLHPDRNLGCRCFAWNYGLIVVIHPHPPSGADEVSGYSWQLVSISCDEGNCVTLCEQLPEGCDLTNCNATFKVLLGRFLCNLLDMCYHRCHKRICNHDQKMEQLDNYIWSLHPCVFLLQHRWWIWVGKASAASGWLQHVWLLA